MVKSTRNYKKRISKKNNKKQTCKYIKKGGMLPRRLIQIKPVQPSSFRSQLLSSDNQGVPSFKLSPLPIIPRNMPPPRIISDNMMPYEQIASTLNLKVFTPNEIAKYESNFRQLFKQKLSKFTMILYSRMSTKEKILNDLNTIQNEIDIFNKPIIEELYGRFLNKEYNKAIIINKELNEVNNILETEGKELEKIKEYANYIAPQGMIAYENRKKVANESRPAIERLASLKTTQQNLYLQILADTKVKYPVEIFMPLFNEDLRNFRNSIEDYKKTYQEEADKEYYAFREQRRNPISEEAKLQHLAIRKEQQKRKDILDIENIRKLYLKPEITSVNQVISESNLL